MIEQGRPQPAAHGHEPLETSVRAIYITAAVLSAVVVASFVLVFVLLGLFAETTGTVPASQFEAPDSMSRRVQQLQSLRTQERVLLEQYQWVNPTAGIARIPIERAMEIVASQGFIAPRSVPVRDRERSDETTSPVPNETPPEPPPP
jgi:hypothetical protein